MHDDGDWAAWAAVIGLVVWIALAMLALGIGRDIRRIANSIEAIQITVEATEEED